MVVGRRRGRLNDEHVLAAHVLLHLDENLHVRKAADDAFGEGDVEIGRDRLRERAVAVACNQLHARPLLRRATIHAASDEQGQAAFNKA